MNFPQLSSWLHHLSDSALSTIVRRRHDQLYPHPVGTEVLADRLEMRESMVIALVNFSALELACLDGIVNAQYEAMKKDPANRSSGAPSRRVGNNPFSGSGSQSREGAPSPSDAEWGAFPMTSKDIHAIVKQRLGNNGYSTTEHPSLFPTQRHVELALAELARSAFIFGLASSSSGATSEGDPFEALAQSEFYTSATLKTVLPRTVDLIPWNGPKGEELLEQLDTLPADERSLLTRLLGAGGLGYFSSLSSPAAKCAERLLDKNLLQQTASASASSAARSELSVRLSPDVRVALEEKPLSLSPQRLSPPPFLTYPLDQPLTEPLWVDADELDVDRNAVTQSAASEAYLTIYHMRELLTVLADSPAQPLRDGTLGVREFKRLTKEVAGGVVGSEKLRFLVTLARDAALIDVGPHIRHAYSPDSLGPTSYGDAWMNASTQTQWAILALAWIGSRSTPWNAEIPNAEGTKLHLLDSELVDSRVQPIRRRMMKSLRGAASGNREQAFHTIAFFCPLSTLFDSARTLECTYNEAEWLGIISGSQTTTICDALLKIPEIDDSNPTRAIQSESEESLNSLIQVCKKALPPETAILIAQGDMTILAPGPLPREMQATMNLLAEVESPGFATLFRITEDRIWKTLEAGRAKEDIESFLTEHIAGGVPQAITYLIADVDRRFGRIRGGHALCYLTTSDAETQAAIINHPIAKELELTALSDTVIIGQIDLHTTLAALDSAGFQAVEQQAGGALVDRHNSVETVQSRYAGTEIFPAWMREENAGIPTWTRIEHPFDEETIQAVVGGLRTADAAGESTHTASTPETWVPLLHAAQRKGNNVIVTYVDKNGQSKRRLMQPVTIAQGYFDGIDTKTSAVHRMIYHRIASISNAQDN